ncbi:MAG: aldehyde dehydrogenase family protein [Solirubrobacteraceae bacterium]|jgi:succinate-semialdehyde dehydrogenase/glutarate-semialdehyde dehydrogenase|nr:aldehyde dehydrogenase family protein [Solirubrobacteraceae bacterium]
MADATATAQLESRSPVDGARLGAVPKASAREVAAAVDRAAEVQRLWAILRLRDRARYMARAAQAVIDERDELAVLLQREQGRPRAEVKVMELLPAVETLQWLAEHGPRILAGERIGFSRTQHPVKRGRWSYEPLGVVAVLGPAAEPFATPLGDIAVALMAGNGVVFKPSPHAALAGERIARVFARAGLPEGLLRVVHGHADTGGALVEAPVAQVRFTGSLRAGRVVAETCARQLKRSVLELGGDDAMLVLADANVTRAARGGTWAAFANAGQSGGSVGRAICLHKTYDRFLDSAVAIAGALRVGDPSDPATEVGPLVSRERLDRLAELVDDAVAQGATVHCGGRVDAGASGAFFAPAVVTGVEPGMRLWNEEAPGPVLVVHRADSEEEAITLANASPLGLGASIWTADRAKGTRIARELQTGMVWMNDHLVARSAPQVPWGGVKGSGIGRARGAIALRTCAEPKAVTWDPPVGRPAWWFPYDASLVSAARAVIGLRSARDADREAALKQGSGALATTAARWARTLRSGR